MLIALIRFWVNGWIHTLYIEPEFHFKYYGFSWVTDFGNYTYLLYLICIIATIGIILGYRYRLSIFMFFLLFTYTELIDKTTYLNHYYFTSCIAFLLCFLPAAHYFSLDALKEKKTIEAIPSWMVDGIKLFLCIVYFYAGIAKINSDWLIEAQPLSIWLTSKYDIPLIGVLLKYKWIHYTASWTGMLYDVFIPFFLLYPKTRKIAFLFVLLFHIMTKIFFPSIGMFPYIMILGATIFFDVKWHKNILRHLHDLGLKLSQKLNFLESKLIPKKAIGLFEPKKYILPVFLIFFFIQLLLPFRYFAYPGELFWNEQGYRFSWRVMLVEKAGSANFKIVDSNTNKYFYVDNSDFLTPVQQKQMSFQPDMILEYGHYLGNHFKSQGHKNVAVFVKSYVSLNGRLSQQFIDPNTNLMELEDTFKHKYWIKPVNYEIKGF